MARIRTIKPEFWTDDLIGSLTREQRLLFIASWNLADDEGLLPWSAPYLKGAVFPFDDDLGVPEIEAAMKALQEGGIIFPYRGGRSQQKLAYIVNFHKHQRINRPSPSKLPPPSLQDLRVREMYAARDDYNCHLCSGSIDRERDLANEDYVASVDHIRPVSAGGSDYPSNIRAAHVTCNKGRGSRTVEQYRLLLAEGKTAAQFRQPGRFEQQQNSVTDSMSGSMSGSVNDPVRGSLPEGERERGLGRGLGEENEKDARERASSFARIWNAWPDKVNRKDAEAAFATVDASPEEIIAGIEAYARTKPKDRHWIGLAKFLAQERWKDRPAAGNGASAEPIETVFIAEGSPEWEAWKTHRGGKPMMAVESRDNRDPQGRRLRGRYERTAWPPNHGQPPPDLGTKTADEAAA